MRILKTYEHEGITFGFKPKVRNWEFQMTSINYTFVTPCPGGFEMGNKIASILKGSVKRSNGVDGLARSNISRLLLA